MSDKPFTTPLIVSVVAFPTTTPERHPHIKVYPWHGHTVIVDKVMCGGPTGEVLTLEMAENLRDALTTVIEDARAKQAKPEPLPATPVPPFPVAVGGVTTEADVAKLLHWLRLPALVVHDSKGGRDFEGFEQAAGGPR